MGLDSMNQLPRAWSPPSEWMQLSPWTDTIEMWKQNKTIIKKIPKQKARPWTHTENSANFLLFLLDSFTIHWLFV